MSLDGPGGKDGFMRFEAQARSLLDRMTVAERIGQLNLLAAGEGLATGAGAPTPLVRRLDSGMVGGIFGTKSRASARALQERAVAGSRLGIPLLFAEDVIHGHRTIFPLPVALACSWDMDLIEETAHFAAREAAAEGLNQVYAPMIDVSRDPRWGRVAESPGEDPTLAGRIAAAMVRGFQGEDPAAPGRVAACLKHFVAYGATQSGRDYDNASLAWEDLFGIYLPPFVAGLDAGAASVMVSFNAVNKVPMHAHRALIEGWLRQTQGFTGPVVSDYTGIMELTAHGIGSQETTVLRALLAGIDMDMVGEDYLAALPKLAEQGLSDPETGLECSAEDVRAAIDRACLRVLSFKARLGLLDDPFARLRDGETAPSRAEGTTLARRAAAASTVLLKNGDLLPLSPDTRIALIGPLAEDQANMIGTWSVSGDTRDVRSLRQAIEDIQGREVAAVIGANLVDEPWLIDRLNVHGTTVAADDRPPEELIAEAVALARAADVAVVAVGEAKEHAGESSSRLSPDLPAPQQALIAALAETGTPLVVMVFAGRPLSLGLATEAADALLCCWHGGTRGPDGAADLLFGRATPSGRLAVTLPAHPGQTPLHHSEEPTGRPATGRFEKFRTGWLDLADGKRGFPFGFGLGYGDVTYGAVSVSDEEIVGDATLDVSVEIRNSGTVEQLETVQLYLSDPVARITRPARWFADFRRVGVKPGAAQTVTFTVTRDMFAYWIAPSLAEVERVWDPGEFLVHVGPNSRDTQSARIRWGG